MSETLGAATEQECAVPERFFGFEPQLTRTPKALAGGRNITVAVLGGASSQGLAAAKSELAWPARMSSVFSERFPAANIKVLNLAVARQTAKRAVQEMDRAVIPLRPMLVIWETGTMEAVRKTDLDEFRGTLQTGIDKLRAGGAEVILMNMQFSRQTDAVIQFEPYLIAMRELSDVNDIPLFPRYAIMRHWAESGSLDLGADNSPTTRRIAARLYDCIGHAMADFVMHGHPPGKRPPIADLER
jgi:hypothetical protein